MSCADERCPVLHGPCGLPNCAWVAYAEDRRRCTDCAHYQRQRCGNHEAAGLMTPVVGALMASMLQRCGGFEGASAAR